MERDLVTTDWSIPVLFADDGDDDEDEEEEEEEQRKRACREMVRAGRGYGSLRL